jgi:hypothetical protein
MVEPLLKGTHLRAAGLSGAQTLRDLATAQEQSALSQSRPQVSVEKMVAIRLVFLVLHVDVHQSLFLSDRVLKLSSQPQGVWCKICGMTRNTVVRCVVTDYLAFYFVVCFYRVLSASSQARDVQLLVAHTAFVVCDEADLLWSGASQ